MFICKYYNNILTLLLLKTWFWNIVIIFAIAVSTVISMETNSIAWHQQGIQFAMKGDYESSLAYFRAACRKVKDNPLYWNDLGVTEMRVGLYEKAKKRFVKALELDPNFDLPTQNMEELERLMPADDFYRPIGQIYEQQHVILPFPTHSAKDFASITHNSSFADVLDGYHRFLSKPFVIRGALQAWGFNLSTFDLDYLTQRFGTRKADYYPHNMMEENVHPLFVSLEQAIDDLKHGPSGVYPGVDASEPGTYIQWNIPPDIWDDLLAYMSGMMPRLLDDSFWTTQCFDSLAMAREYHHKTHWKMVLMGDKGSGMFNHKDYLQSSSFQFQLLGSKRWHICPPSENSKLYEPGDVDLFNPDYSRYPKARRLQCYEAVIEPGDVIYYPSEHWHQTMNLETPTVALTGTLVTHESYASTIRQLDGECLGAARIFVADPPTRANGLCAQLLTCYDLWKSFFEGEQNSVSARNTKVNVMQHRVEGGIYSEHSLDWFCSVSSAGTISNNRNQFSLPSSQCERSRLDDDMDFGSDEIFEGIEQMGHLV